jgi:hypothetical protein
MYIRTQRALAVGVSEIKQLNCYVFGNLFEFKFQGGLFCLYKKVTQVFENYTPP